MKTFIQSNEKLVSAAMLLLRISLGAIMFAHGSQKVLGIWGGKGLETTVQMMSKSLRGPDWLPYLSAFTEFLGGAAVLLGLFTRFFSFAVLINMSVAVFAVHLKNGFFAPTGFEFPGSLAMTSLAITIAGPGIFSLDQLIFGARAGKPSSRTSFSVPSGKAQFRPAK
jgi:putative oxidoreductase